MNFGIENISELEEALAASFKEKGEEVSDLSETYGEWREDEKCESAKVRVKIKQYLLERANRITVLRDTWRRGGRANQNAHEQL